MIGLSLALGIFTCRSLGNSLAETLDRVAASVDNRAITESDVKTEYRLEQFTDGHMPGEPPDTAAWNQARDRLIDQDLLSEEMEKSNLQAASPVQLERELDRVHEKFPNEQAFNAALKSVGMNREQILERFERRDRILRLIEQRLRPDAWVDRGDIETYYQKTFVPEFTQRHLGTAPPLDDVEDQIREILTQKKIDQLLQEWLQELRSSHQVEIHSF